MIRKLFSPRVISAIVSAVGAIVSAIFATGCVLRCEEVGIKGFDSAIFSQYFTSTNTVNFK